MKRKLIAVVLSAICIFALSACNTDTTGTNESTRNGTTTGGVINDAGDIVEDAGEAVKDAGNDVSRGVSNAANDMREDSSTSRASSSR